VVFDVKELGGSDTFRPWWDKYYDDDVDGVVFFIDLTSNRAGMDAAITALKDVEEHAALREIPFMVVGTKQDVDGAMGAEEFEQLVADALPDVAKHRMFKTATVTATNTASVKAAFNSFSEGYETDTLHNEP
jgi:signal recognition particle receptor subunit beta